MENTKVWFITGASKGLGLALVKLLLSAGNKVAATSRNIAEFSQHSGENFLPLQVDITSEESVTAAVKKTIETFGQLDVVVNNAGYFILGSMEELSEHEFRQSMEVNVYGTTNVIRTVMPYLRAQKSGHIFNFSSLAGYIGHGNAGAYHAVKFAVIGISEALAQEAKPFGVKVTVVVPGYFRTSFLDSSIMIAKNRIAAYNGNQMEEAMKKMDGNQAGDPDKLAAILIRMTDEPNPPVHLLMGPDAYEGVMAKQEADKHEFETWKDVTLSTDFDH